MEIGAVDETRYIENSLEEVLGEGVEAGRKRVVVAIEGRRGAVGELQESC